MWWSIKPILRGNYTKADGTKSVHIRLTLNRIPYYYSIRVKVNPASWDESAGHITGRTGTAFADNTRIKNFVDKADSICRLLENRNKLDKQEFDKHWNQNDDSNLVYSFAEIVLKEDKTDGRSKDYIKGKKSRLNIANEYHPRLKFSDINYNWIRGFELWLHAKGHNINYIANVMISLKSVVNRALKKGLVEKNPFFGFKIRKEPVSRDFHSKEDLKKLIRFIPKTPGLQIIRLRYLFQCGTGLRYSDMNKAAYTWINGDFLINPRQKKTKKQGGIPLTDLARLVIKELKKYDKPENGRLFPQITNQDYNKFIKQYATKAGIRLQPTSHIARHTFATIMLTAGADTRAISDFLGVTAKVAEEYAKLVGEKKLQDAVKFNDYMKKK